jgi:hypothetical protein
MPLKHRSTHPDGYAAAPLGWGPPGRYYGRAGYRNDIGGGCSTGKGRCDPAVVCLTACAGWLTVHARRHPREVGPLSGGGTTPIRPIPGRPSLAPSSFPRSPFGRPYDLPAPRGRATGLPRSTGKTEWVRSCLSAGGLRSACHGTLRPGTRPRTFWSQPVSSLPGGRIPSVADSPWLVEQHGLCGTSPGLTLPLLPRSRPPCCWQSRCRLTLSPPARRLRLRCPAGFAPRRCQRRTLRQETPGRTGG